AFLRQRQSRAAVIDGRDKVLGATEAERAMADGLDLVVHSFQRSFVQSDFGPSKNALQMGAQHPDEPLDRLQPRAHRRTHPLLQVGLGPLWLAVLPEQLKSFLQVPGPHDRKVPTHQRGQPLSLIRGKIPRILQQQPTAGPYSIVQRTNLWLESTRRKKQGCANLGARRKLASQRTNDFRRRKCR